jgi:hypothetical protein
MINSHDCDYSISIKVKCGGGDVGRMELRGYVYPLRIGLFSFRIKPWRISSIPNPLWMMHQALGLALLLFKIVSECLFSTELLAATYDNPASSENFDQLTCPC